jgi:hypothetical protein
LPYIASTASRFRIKNYKYSKYGSMVAMQTQTPAPFSQIMSILNGVPANLQKPNPAVLDPICSRNGLLKRMSTAKEELTAIPNQKRKPSFEVRMYGLSLRESPSKYLGSSYYDHIQPKFILLTQKSLQTEKHKKSSRLM